MAFGLASAASWGAGDFSGGLATRRAPAAGVVIASQGVGIALLVVLALATGEAVPSAGQLGWAALAGANGAFGLLALYSALASGRMGIAAPISGVVGAVVPVLVGMQIHGPPGIDPARGLRAGPGRGVAPDGSRRVGSGGPARASSCFRSWPE